MISRLLATLILVGSFATYADVQPSVNPIQVYGQISNVNDAVTLPCLGQQWASFRVRTDNLFNGTLQGEISLDNGVNWISAAYATNQTVISANPSVTSTMIAVATVTTWSTPLPGNSTRCRARATSIITAGLVFAYNGDLYAFGVPVVAVLVDFTGATTTAIDTGILDTSGWTFLEGYTNAVSGTAVQMLGVDDTGASTPAYVNASTPAAGGFVSAFGPGIPTGSPSVPSWGTVPTGNILPKRFRATMAAPASGADRIRLEVRR